MFKSTDINRLIFPSPHNSDEGGGPAAPPATSTDYDPTQGIAADTEEEFMEEFAKIEGWNLNANDKPQEPPEEQEEPKEPELSPDELPYPTDKKTNTPDDAPSGAPEDADEGDSFFDEADNKEYVRKQGKWVDADTLEDPNADETNAESDEVEYIDDVIPGLKGNDFAKLPEDSRKALATYYDTAQKIKEEHDRVAEAWKILENDPIAQQRLQLAQAGRSLDQYELPKPNDDVLEKLLESSDKVAARKIFGDALENYGRVVADNTRIEIERTARNKETNRIGKDVFIKARNMLPEKDNIGDFDERDTSKNDEYTNAILEYCHQRRWKYDKVAEYEPAELYALVAIKNGWPIAINTKERDQQIRKESAAAALKHFTRPRGSEVARGMRQKGSNTAVRSEARGGPVRRYGVDVIKLAQSPEYHERVLGMKPMDETWLQKVSELESEGQKILERRTRNRRT